MTDQSISHKVCNKCSESLPLERYEPRPGSGDGYRNICKNCRNIQRYGRPQTLHKKWRVFEGVNQKQCGKCDQWLDANSNNFYPSKNGKWGFNSYCNKCKSQAVMRGRAADYAAKIMREARMRSPEKYNQHALNYRIKNKIKINERDRNRRQIDPMFRLSENMRSLINYSIRGMQNDGRLLRLLNYKIDELKNWLEKKFVSGMTWENYGKWHIDHIRPISSFNYKSVEDEEFKQCWALENLQPLWAVDNQRKSNKTYVHEIPKQGDQ